MTKFRVDHVNEDRVPPDDYAQGQWGLCEAVHG